MMARTGSKGRFFKHFPGRFISLANLSRSEQREYLHAQILKSRLKWAHVCESGNGRTVALCQSWSRKSIFELMKDSSSIQLAVAHMLKY